MVYVQDINGKPMMPTTRHGKVRRLLKENKAVVVSLCPFTIKLTYVTSDYKGLSATKNITYKKFKLSRCKRFMIQKEMN